MPILKGRGGGRTSFMEEVGFEWILEGWESKGEGSVLPAAVL